MSEVNSICGSQALACYGASANLMVAPADDPSANTSAEAVVTHEYGHHIAAHRSNAPWPAVDYGTKRWATYTHVCTDAESGKLYPGAEQLPRYQLNPGEAFAEAYRVLNERAAGLPELAWQIVDRSLYPDDTALALLRADVTTPWTGPTTVTRTGRVAKGKGAQTYTFTTPLDGPVQVTLQAPRGARLSFELVSSLGDRATRTGTGTLSFKATLCGDRSLTIRVKRISGAGPFRLSVARP
jgi:hypothetical protein